MIFISHAWEYKFLAVLIALKYHFRDKPNVVLWFDIFTVNQHKTATYDFSWWSTTFKSAIASFGHTVMVLAPWQNPLPLTRSWCLFELWSTVDTKSNFEVAMSESEIDQFLKDICEDTEESVNKMLGTIDVSKSEAFHKVYEQQIKAAVENSVGFGNLNMVVFKQLRSWMVKTVQNRLDSSPVDSPDYEKLAAALGELFRHRGQYQKAELKLMEALERRRNTLGDRHADTLASFRMLGNLYVRMGNCEKAMEFCQAAYEGCNQVLGEDHKETLKSIVCMGNLHYTKKEYDTAISYYDRAFEGRKRVLGETHADTIKTLSNLANCYKQRKDYDAAVPLYERALDRWQHALGGNHPDTLAAMCNLANLHRSKKEYDAAERNYSACRAGRMIVLGAKHSKTLEVSAYLAECLRNQSRIEEALSLAKATRAELLAIDRGADDTIKYCEDTIQRCELVEQRVMVYLFSTEFEFES